MSRGLRIVTVVTFVPAFPLCIAHGVLSASPVPAVGLVPLAFSAGTSLFLLVRQAKAKKSYTAPLLHQEGPTDDEEQGGGAAAAQAGGASTEEGEPAAYGVAHPILVFAVDTILAAALMVVLVFTWIRASGRAEVVMLAAYATIPLLINFFIHLYLAVREFSRGLALPGLIQWVAWQAVPPDCPDCGHRLRPESTPPIPWYESIPPLSAPALPAWKLPQVKVPAWKAPALKVPAWFKGNGDGQQGLEDDEDGEDYTYDGDRQPYRDDPGTATAGESSAPVAAVAAEPEAVEVVSKKSKKGKNNTVLGDESSPWDT
ncbi:hypothetical protein BX600DRAFT_510131 [Xylariales sp. PMI_506]|nr:hypothetical protein BX600DRAFT_510131 [Xylariales sp. PMI_506]